MFSAEDAKPRTHTRDSLSMIYKTNDYERIFLRRMKFEYSSNAIDIWNTLYRHKIYALAETSL